MPKVNGNGGNNNDLIKGLQAYYQSLKAKATGNTNKPAETQNVPMVQSQNVKNSEMGDELLESANFYSGMGLTLNKTQKPEAGSLEELQQVLPTLTVANADRTDKKTAFDAIEENDWSSYLTKAYAYGKISEDTMSFLNNSEQMDKLNELARLA